MFGGLQNYMVERTTGEIEISVRAKTKITLKVFVRAAITGFMTSMPRNILKIFLFFIAAIVLGSSIQIDWILENCNHVIQFSIQEGACKDNIYRVSLGWLMGVPLQFILTSLLILLFYPVMQRKTFKQKFLAVIPPSASSIIFGLLPFNVSYDFVIIISFFILVLFISKVVLATEVDDLQKIWRIIFLQQSKKAKPRDKAIFFVLFTSVLIVGIAIQLFTQLHQFQNSDSLIQSLVSLQKWTPFFWEQSRLGMIVPALAMVFRNPEVNIAIIYLCYFTIIFVGLFYYFRTFFNASSAVLAYVIVVLLTISGYSSYTFANYSVTIPLFSSLALLFLAIFCLKQVLNRNNAKAYYFLYLVFMSFSFSLTPVNALLLFFQLLFVKPKKIRLIEVLKKYLNFQPTSKINRQSYLWLVCTFSFFLLFGIATVLTSSGSVKLSYIATSLPKLIEMHNKQILSGSLALSLLIAMAIVLNIFYWFKEKQRVIRFILPIFISLLAMLFLISSSLHIKVNDYNARYVAGLWWLLLILVAIPIAGLLQRYRKLTMLLSSVCIIASICLLFYKSKPSLSMVSIKKIISKQHKVPVQEFLSHQCEVVAGHFWRVWPAVWVLNAYSKSTSFYGLSFRSRPTHGLWVTRKPRVCAYKDDKTMENILTSKVSQGMNLHILQELHYQKTAETKSLIIFDAIN